MRISEEQLDHAFAEILVSSNAFQRWVLSRGRFSRFAGAAVLLADEQGAARRNAKHWWKHWWCRMPDGSESETDIFAVFQADSFRFALHVENKPSDGKLLFDQAARYRSRAAFKAFNSAWLNYSDFETILLAPRAFIQGHREQAEQFDVAMSYEAVSQHVPLFAEAVKPG